MQWILSGAWQILPGTLAPTLVKKKNGKWTPVLAFSVNVNCLCWQ